MGEQVAIDRCPSLGDLVLAADGGLSPSHKASMTAHLRHCAACMERLHQANAFLEAHAELSDDEADASVLEARVSSGTRRGEAVVSDDGAADAAMHLGVDKGVGSSYDSEAKAAARLQEFGRRLHKQKQESIHRQPSARMRRWLPAAALIPLMLIAGLTFSRMQTVVRAEELLSRASHHERSLPADRMGRVRIRLTTGIPAFAPLVSGGTRSAMPRVTPFLVVRDVTGGIALDAWPDNAAANREYAALAETLSNHGFEMREPLGLAGVQAWRASLGEKHEEVFNRGDLLVLKTSTSEGALREVELTVRRDNYHIVKLSLAFEGLGRLEIDEVEEPVRRAVNTAAPLAPSATSPAGTPAPAPALVARAAAAGTVAAPVTPPAGRTIGTQPGLSRWLDRTFGNLPEQRRTFVPDLQRRVNEVRQQLGALDTLARRYPEAEVEQQWNGADRAALRRRVDEAYGSISRALNDLDTRIGILFGSTDRTGPFADAPPDWRRRASVALAHAERMDREVRHLLTFDDVPAAQAGATASATGATSGTGSTPVLSTFGALWDVVHAPTGGPAAER